jgi:hypothetical protein
MAVEAMAKSPDPAVDDNVFRSDVECEFEVAVCSTAASSTYFPVSVTLKYV